MTLSFWLYRKVCSSNLIMGEARVALLTIKYVVAKGLNKTILERNSQIVVSAFLNQDLQLEWQLKPLILFFRFVNH